MNQQSPSEQPKWRAEQWLGRRAERRLRITRELVEKFTELSGDISPIHVSDDAAQSKGFDSLVVHGMLLGSLLTQITGTQIPGADGFTQQVQLSFRNPCYVDDEIVISVVVAEFFESVQSLTLKVRIERVDGMLLATGEVQSALR
jgi:acyl dehydratase